MTRIAHDFAGTPTQQALQRAVVDHYADDPRVLAVALFGSLGRGNWDEQSDLDLDLVMADDVELEVVAEVRALCTAFAPLGALPLLIVPQGDDSADVVLDSLLGLSIRYHPLATTSPTIVDGLRVLSGSLTIDQIVAAAEVNRTSDGTLLARRLDIIVRWTIDVDKALQRGNFWQALYLLQRMREELLTLFAETHGGGRPYHVFDEHAPVELKDRLRDTLNAHDVSSAQSALTRVTDLLEQDLAAFSNGSFELTQPQREVLGLVRERSANSR